MPNRPSIDPSMPRSCVLSHRLIHTSKAFFGVGVVLSVYIGATDDFRLICVHVHTNLLGWSALGLAGLLYTVRPALQRNRLAHLHYWLHTIGLLLFIGGLAWRSVVDETTIFPIAVGASMVALGLLSFAMNMATARKHSGRTGVCMQGADITAQLRHGAQPALSASAPDREAGSTRWMPGPDRPVDSPPCW